MSPRRSTAVPVALGQRRVWHSLNCLNALFPWDSVRAGWTRIETALMVEAKSGQASIADETRPPGRAADLTGRLRPRHRVPPCATAPDADRRREPRDGPLSPGAVRELLEFRLQSAGRRRNRALQL